ncbi:MAG: nucleotidyltransferase family protein [Planctomycetota bacterium]
MTKRDILDRIAKHAPDLRERFGVKGLWLFGSAARDQARADSDVDMVVEFAGPPTFDAYMDLKFRLEEILGVRVDLVTRGAIRPTLKERIEKDSVLVA